MTMKLIVSLSILASFYVNAVQSSEQKVLPVNLGSYSEGEVSFLNTQQGDMTLPFSEGVKVGGTVYLSGQIGFNPETKTLVKGGIVAEAQSTLLGIKGSLGRMGYEMKDVVKCTVMLTDIEDFSAFNQVYKQHFSSPYPARSTMAVKGLALGASIEIECIAAK